MADQPTTIDLTHPPADPRLLTVEYYLEWALTHPTPQGKAPIDEYARIFNIGPEDLTTLQQNITAAAQAGKATEAEKPKKKEEEKKKEEAAPKPAEPEKPRVAAPPKQPTVKPQLVIKRTPYPKWWNDEGIAKIALSSPGSQFVITARGDYSLYIATIVLTVSGECDITFAFGSSGSSGPMDLGGADEPRGIVIAMGNSPAPCGSGSFMVTATSAEAVSIGGFVSYFLWKKE
jgi:hypothetical protein